MVGITAGIRRDPGFCVSSGDTIEAENFLGCDLTKV